ncbi:DUF6778 family protein [Phaeovulum sp.]|uniref:DUF6778 family protein n=1 Tax=Phaeovulum sp. TaxID=2934796 RepID=UPI0039E4A96D
MTTPSALGRRSFLLLATAMTTALAACGSNWATEYEPVPEQARDWRLAAVNVTVPQTLSVSEDIKSYVPRADIVWQEEPLGDRRAQVGWIVKEGITAGATGLRGSRPVRFQVTVSKFHALNKKARRSAPAGTGVHDIRYTVQVVDARTGQELLAPQYIQADFPGKTGAAAVEAEKRGLTQRVAIVAHLTRTTAGWLGLGADNRTDFTRAGG